MIISAEIIQELCINRLKPLATYNLNLEIYVENDLKEKTIFNSFVNVPFVNRQHPRVFIQERGNYHMGPDCHCFTVFTLPCNDRILPSDLFSGALEK